ncbi:hypothetical protein [Yaravirus sp. 'brasiliensis']|uniref:Uncharacterized protein n=1 Tax=Yaravirus sp. 'brasiliensis' TaxID=2739681 RepID=A0AAE7B616_9VIRU|nr:hypothetical protein QKS73_gp74 [Yaravirus brasiliensis]QKE44403.1 hypothetical protein [Yaravirus brasiliensis]
MSAYDAFLVELFQYTGKDTLKDLSYEDLSRATNKVCKQIYGAKPSEDQKKEQANIKRKVKMEWKKENETDEGVIKTSMYEEKAAEVTEEQVEALEGALRYSGSETDLKAEKAVEELREIVEQKKEEDCVVQEPTEAEEERLDELIRRDRRERETAAAEKETAEEEHIERPAHFGGFDFSPVCEQAAAKESELMRLAVENSVLHLANAKLHGLIDGLCIGSSIVLSGLLVIMLMYKFI